MAGDRAGCVESYVSTDAKLICCRPKSARRISFGRPNGSLKRAKTSSGGPLSQSVPQLPQEVWTIIAGHMTVRDWVRISSACRTMHSVRLDTILAKPKSLAELLWVAKRWQHAWSLDLDFEPLCSRRLFTQSCFNYRGEQLRPSELQALMFEQAAPFCVLQALSLNLGEWWGSTGPQEWLFPMLVQSSQLRVLHLKMRKSVMLPVLGQLTHLSVSSSHLPHHCTRGFGDLPRLQVLVLCIENYAEDNHARELNVHRGLDLRQCKQLRALVLKNRMPISLQCPEGCSVCVESQVTLCAHHWEYLRKFCTACHLTTLNDKVASNYYVLHIVAMQCSTLTYLSIGTGVLGIRSLQLKNQLVIGADVLPSLKHLRMESRGCAFVRFKGAVRLESFRVRCRNKMRLLFEDVAGFAESLKDAVLSWGQPTTECNTTQALLGALACKKKHYTLEFTSEMSILTLGQPLPQCGCNACESCLMQGVKDLI